MANKSFSSDLPSSVENKCSVQMWNLLPAWFSVPAVRCGTWQLAWHQAEMRVWVGHFFPALMSASLALNSLWSTALAEIWGIIIEHVLEALELAETSSSRLEANYAEAEREIASVLVEFSVYECFLAALCCPSGVSCFTSWLPDWSHRVRAISLCTSVRIGLGRGCHTTEFFPLCEIMRRT